MEETISGLRSCAASSKYIIFDGAYLKEEAPEKNPYSNELRYYTETKKALTIHGDEIVKEIFVPDEESKQINNRYTNLIRRRAAELSGKYPDNKNLFEEYVHKQEEESLHIEKYLAGCIWCIQKKNVIQT